MDKIVIGVDGSDGAAQALRWAVRRAQGQDQALTAAMTWTWLDQRHVDGGDFDPDYGGEQATEALEEFVRRAIGADDAATVATEVRNDLPAAGLLAAAEDADLLVLGARGLGGFRGLLLGSVSQQCLHHATIPTAVIRQSPGTDAGRIVVGTDASEAAEPALRWAMAEGARRGAAIEVVHAYQPPVGADMLSLVAPDPGWVADRTRLVAAQAVAAAEAVGAEWSGEPTVASDGAAAALLAAAEGADLVVVGSRGRGGFRSLVLGSVSNQVARHAGCAVVVVPPGPRSHG